MPTNFSTPLVVLLRNFVDPSTQSKEMHIKSSLSQSGLTLIECLIVVILLGIVAAAAVPSFPLTNTPNVHSVLEKNLSTLQTAIRLYGIQHHGVYPGQVRHTDGTKVSTADEARSAFKAQLLLYSDATGKTSPVRSKAFPFGPYLLRGIPLNPLQPQSSNTLVVLDKSQLAPGRQAGWKLILSSGEIFPIYPLGKE
jgi:prepilin-type N-terminal cleavage/methylation domain-containing protein